VGPTHHRGSAGGGERDLASESAQSLAARHVAVQGPVRRPQEAGARRHGFGRRPYFETLICRDGRRPVGFALYFFTYSTFLGRPSLYLEDLFVLPGDRGLGAGKALLRALAAVAMARGCGRMEWRVLDWNAPAMRFYKRIGARLHSEWVLTRLKGAPLKRLARTR